jgi:hypothetical protein
LASRQGIPGNRAWWDQLVQAGVDLGVRLSSQERAVRNARLATTELSRARVERDAVELYLADLEEERLASLEDAAEGGLPRQRREAVGEAGHTGA